MTEFLNQLAAWPQETIYVIYFSLLALTCMGLFPNNSDIMLFGAGFLSAGVKLDFGIILFGCILTVLFAENFVFFLGRKFGPRVYTFKLINRLIKPDKVIKMGKFFGFRPFHFIVYIRMTPIIRPFLFLSLGTVRPKVRDFIRSHIPITSLYISISVTMGYYFGELIEKYFLAYRIPFFITLVLVWAFLIKRLAKQFNNFDFEQMKEITPRSEINKVG